MNNWNTAGYRVFRATVMNRLNPYCGYWFVIEGTEAKQKFINDFLDVLPILYCMLNRFHSVSLTSMWLQDHPRSSCEPVSQLADAWVQWQRWTLGDSWDCQRGATDTVVGRLQAWRLEADWQCWDVDSKHFLQGRFMSQWSARDSVPRCHSRSATSNKLGLVMKSKRSQSTKW